MDMKKILQALDTASSKPVEGSNDMKKFVSIVTEGSNPHKVALPVQMAMQHYQEEKKPAVAKKESILKKYFQEAEELINQEKAERKEHLKMYSKKVAQRVMENSRRSSFYNPMDYERDQQRQMDWEKRDFKRREMEHELGDEEEYYRQQVAKDRGPWYLRINGKILKSQGEPKVFDWKKGANNYALAILKNKPELQGKIMLTRRAEDDVEAKEGVMGDVWTGIKGITGGLTPEDIAKQQSPAGDAMRKLLAFKADPKYATNPNAQKQIQMRIDDLTTRINLDKGMPVDAQGNPKQVLPPEQFKE